MWTTANSTSEVGSRAISARGSDSPTEKCLPAGGLASRFKSCNHKVVIDSARYNRYVVIAHVCAGRSTLPRFLSQNLVINCLSSFEYCSVSSSFVCYVDFRAFAARRLPTRRSIGPSSSGEGLGGSRMCRQLLTNATSDDMQWRLGGASRRKSQNFRPRTTERFLTDFLSSAASYF
eukprot:2561281-Pleurochrysis_carterae.AAC.1